MFIVKHEYYDTCTDGSAVNQCFSEGNVAAEYRCLHGFIKLYSVLNID